MRFDWRGFRERHPRLFISAIVLKKLRTKAGVAVVAICMVAAFYRRHVPLDPEELTGRSAMGAILILAGIVVRLAALGCLKKKEELATTGIYSLCRHPLYLGSILMTYGFCFLLNVPANFIAATVYFLVFYPFAILWEEVRLSERYGQAHEQYALSTPLLLPVGRYRSCGFRFGQAMRKGGAILVGVTALLVVAIDAMAEFMANNQ